MTKVELTKEELLEIIEKEIEEVQELNIKGERDAFIDKLSNTKDFINSANTEDDFEKVLKSTKVQDILGQSKYKREYI